MSLSDPKYSNGVRFPFSLVLDLGDETLFAWLSSKVLLNGEYVVHLRVAHLKQTVDFQGRSGVRALTVLLAVEDKLLELETRGLLPKCLLELLAGGLLVLLVVGLLSLD